MSSESYICSYIKILLKLGIVNEMSVNTSFCFLVDFFSGRENTCALHNQGKPSD
jgi:hypothetical protein